MSNWSSDDLLYYDDDPDVQELLELSGKGEESIEKRVECQVCFQRAKIPIKMCIWAKHVVCVECIGSSVMCPTCETPLTDGITQRMEEQINLINSNKPSCRYYQQGCRKSKFEGANHEVFCKFRPAVCRMAGCPVQSAMPLHELMKHVTGEHRNKLITGDHRFRWKKDPILPVIYRGTLFWLKLPEPNRESTTIKFEAIPIRNRKWKYSINIKVRNSNSTFTKSIISYVRKEEEEEGVKVRVEGLPELRYKDVDYPGQACLDIEGKELDNFINGFIKLSLT